MRLLSLRSFVLVFLLVLASSLFAQSQATTGVIEGTVTDATGGVLPGVTVTLRNTATNFEQVESRTARAASAASCCRSVLTK